MNYYKYLNFEFKRGWVSLIVQVMEKKEKYVLRMLKTKTSEKVVGKSTKDVGATKRLFGGHPARANRARTTNVAVATTMIDDNRVASACQWQVQSRVLD